MTLTSLSIPMRYIGPVRITGDIDCSVRVPLATFESPMWPSTNRGASVSRLSGGIRTTLLSNCMTRSILVEGPNAHYLRNCVRQLNLDTLNQITSKTSQYTKLQNLNHQINGKLLFLRLEFNTGDAAGHNMATKAADAIISWLTQEFSQLVYVSISGNYCVDKKVSAVNGILGRGKSVVAEIIIPESICLEKLKTTPQAICDLNLKKNLIGSILSGSLRTANAHFANLLLGFYLALGQDAANIVEGSQGVVYTEMQGKDLYFSITIPNIIVGCIGNGKEYEFVKENLAILGCDQSAKPGANAERLAMICAATVLCGELSLLAAQCNSGELMQAHYRFERKKEDYQESKASKETST
jgi:hydroxymethylglutaryl-CoA reductase (NADPH)